MSIIDVTAPLEVEKIIYPESDGKPMADNNVQYHWITTIEGNLQILFAAKPDVFIVGDMLWYPGTPKGPRLAPDVMVVFGRPKGKRGSYAQPQEENIAPQVVFEILSPGNTKGEMKKKLQFYQTYGVEEYYEYDPQRGTLQGWQRQGHVLVAIKPMVGWVSPRLGIQFELEDTLEGLELALYYPDGRRFLSYVELGLFAQAETKARVKESRARYKAETRAEQAETRAEQAETRVEQAETRAEAEAEARAKAEAHAKELEAKLRQAGLL